MEGSTSLSSPNMILSAFDQATIDRLTPDLERIELPLGFSLYRPHEEITHVYFPENSMASIVATTADGESCEVGVVGNEGAVGLQVLMGARTSPHEAMIQIANGGYRLPVNVLLKEFNRCEDAHDILLSFVNKLMIQMSQTTLCNRLHSVEERLSRWLLMCYDRVPTTPLGLTQEFLGIMLGVTRVSVTLAASNLQSIGHIKYTRGSITITDREGLEDISCECYRIVKDEYDRPENKRAVREAA